MADEPITEMFESIDAEPSPEFTAALFGRMTAELAAGPAPTSTGPDEGPDPGRDYMQTLDDRRAGAADKNADPHRSRRWLLAAAAVAVAAAAAGVVVVAQGGGESTTPTMKVTTPEKSATWDGTGAGGLMFSDGKNAWVASGTTLQRLGADGQPDGTTVALPNATRPDGEVTYSTTLDGKFIVPGDPPSLVEPKAGAGAQPMPGLPTGDGSGALWASDGSQLWTAPGGGTVSSIDPATGEVTGSFTIDGVNGPVAVFYAAGSLWICFNDPSPSLVRVDPADGKVLASFPAFTYGVTEGAGSVWYADYDTGEAVRIDPATNTEITRVPVVGTRLWGVFDIGGYIWASAYGAGRVDVIDPATNTVIASVKGVPNASQVVGAGDRVYIRANGETVQVNPAP